MIKIIIAGSRDFNDYKKLKSQMDLILSYYDKMKEITIISGGCRGADALGEKYAVENNIKVEIFKPDWHRYGLAAGPIRNEQMVVNCDCVICFWDGKSSGTKSMIEFTKKHNKTLKIVYV